MPQRAGNRASIGESDLPGPADLPTLPVHFSNEEVRMSQADRLI
jgi:hypothetical protein